MGRSKKKKKKKKRKVFPGEKVKERIRQFKVKGSKKLKTCQQFRA